MKAKPELVLPAGDLHRAKIAFAYGADAVYVGLDKYSLRKAEVRFTVPQIKKAVEYAHSAGKKVYVTFNVFAHNKHLKSLGKDMKTIGKFGPDAFIISDPGVVAIAQKIAPKIPIHLSTQANTVNVASVKFWLGQGVKRIVLARELSLSEVAEINKAVPKMELEIFVHGAMCISYSGRCLLSAAMTGRSANLGQCAQPCRWQYKLRSDHPPAGRAGRPVIRDQEESFCRPELACSESIESISGSREIPDPWPTRACCSGRQVRNDRYYLEEAKRPGEYYPIEEDGKGTYVMNSKDLCMIEHLDKIMAAGVTGLKIEGRNKTDFYVATVARTYKRALALVASRKYQASNKRELKKELENLTHRDYTTGFLFGDAKNGETFKSREPITGKKYLGFVEKKSDDIYQIIVKNKLELGKKYELLTLDQIISFKITEMQDKTRKSIVVANPGRKNEKILVKTDQGLFSGSFIREL